MNRVFIKQKTKKMYIIIKNKINGGKCLFEGDKVSLN